jgi:hypothetical protein
MMWKSKNSIRLKSHNRFVPLENLNNDVEVDDMDISRAWESIREILKASAT